MKCCLLFGSCPSTRTFARCFLQTPPCDGSACIITRPSPPSGWPEDFHLRAAEQCPAHNEPANAGDASRATIWQGNCHVEDQLFYSNITLAPNTIPIQYPISNCPAKPTGSFKRLYRKRADRGCRLLQALFRRRASDTALTFFFRSQPPRWHLPHKVPHNWRLGQPFLGLLKPSVTEGKRWEYQEVQRSRSEKASQNHDCHGTLDLPARIPAADRQGE